MTSLFGTVTFQEQIRTECSISIAISSDLGQRSESHHWPIKQEIYKVKSQIFFATKEHALIGEQPRIFAKVRQCDELDLIFC